MYHTYGLFQFIGDVTSYTQKRNVIDIHCTNARVEITILTDDLFRIRMTNDGAFQEDRSYSILPVQISATVFPIVEQGDNIKLSTRELALVG